MTLLLVSPIDSLSLNMNDNKALCVVFLCAAASLALIWRLTHHRSKLPFPPGPKGLPLLGNLLDVPRDVPIWRTFTSISQNYGMCHPFQLPPIFRSSGLLQDKDVLFLRLTTEDLVVLNSSKAISDLVEKRSNIYSDRVSIQTICRASY
jgi:hypothetical protein